MRTGRAATLRARSQRDHFAQHSQAIAKKTDFATLSVVPAHRNFTGSQSGMLRQIKQFDIKGEPVQAGGLKNRAAHIETKGLEPALCVPNGSPVAVRTSRLNARPPCSRRHG